MMDLWEKVHALNHKIIWYYRKALVHVNYELIQDTLMEIYTRYLCGGIKDLEKIKNEVINGVITDVHKMVYIDGYDDIEAQKETLNKQYPSIQNTHRTHKYRYTRLSMDFISQLTPNYQHLLKLEAQGLTRKEIAAQTDKSVINVNSQFFRIRTLYAQWRETGDKNEKRGWTKGKARTKKHAPNINENEPGGQAHIPNGEL